MNALNYRSAAALLLAAAVGCDAPALPTGPATPPAASTPAPEEKPIVAGVPGEELPDNEVPVTDIPRKFTAQDPIKGRRTRQDAKEGANVLGISSVAAGGLYAKHQSMIMAIDHANDLYNPQHNFSYPKTQESFMKDVVALALNGVPLPEIPADHEYCYVPAQGQVGLQIRLVPGSPNSKVPAGTTPEQAIEMLGGSLEPEEPAYVPPTTQISPPPTDPAAEPAAAAAPGEPEGGRDDAGNPLDLRERAAGFGGVSPTDGLAD
jgi:hypothetical protein